MATSPLGGGQALERAEEWAGGDRLSGVTGSPKPHGGGDAPTRASLRLLPVGHVDTDSNSRRASPCCRGERPRIAGTTSGVLSSLFLPFALPCKMHRNSAP